MKKISQHLLAAAVVAAAGVSASAEVLTPEQALDRALPQARMAAPGLAKAVLAYTVEAEELPAVYVFAKENKGFMLVSADDAATPLLGYIGKGNFDADNMAPAFKYWMGEYARQIAYARENGLCESTPRLARATRASIAPMVKTNWDQGNPYNLLAPTYQGAHLPTGCVATAAAQVMKYHEWPATAGTGKFSYTSSVQGVATPLEINVEETTLEWSKMLDTYTAANPGTEEQQMAVATLMQLVGYGVEMNYAAAGSGAQTSKVAQILAENFDYDASVQYLSRDCYTLDQWEEMIYNNLTDYGPVLYDGTTINSEGHAFVLDGYEDRDGVGYFHFNWGWGGMSDGYFTIGALDPEAMGTGGAASGAGFNYGQDATFGIRPNQGGERVPLFHAAYAFTSGPGVGLVISPSSNFNLGREVTVSYENGGFYNHSYFTVEKPKYGLHIVGEGQDFYRWMSTNPTDEVKPNYGAASYTVLLSGVKENSTYVLTPAYKVGDKIYEMGMPYGLVRSYVLKTNVHNGNLYPVGNGLEISDVVVPEHVSRNQRITLTAKLNNTGENYYFGHIAPAFLTKEYGEYSVLKVITNFTLNLNAGESEAWEYSMRATSSAGFVDGNTYYFTFIDPQNGEILSTPAKFSYGTSGIADIEADSDATPEYFNLQGVRVAQPQAGQVYIVRRGEKVSKELVK